MSPLGCCCGWVELIFFLLPLWFSKFSHLLLQKDALWGHVAKGEDFTEDFK